MLTDTALLQMPVGQASAERERGHSIQSSQTAACR
jgi:hypothetical protein